MLEIYEAQDRDQVLRQKKRIQIGMLVLSIVLLVPIVYSFIIRLEPLTIGLTILLFGLLIFLWDLKLKPVRAYARFLEDLHDGGTVRENQGVVVLLEEEPSYRDGNNSYRLILNVDENMEPEGERQYFFDANKPRPDLREGQWVFLRFHGNDVLAYEVREAVVRGE